jgi:pimeloyl-ACP methyl ester carboxylesterase
MSTSRYLRPEGLAWMQHWQAQAGAFESLPFEGRRLSTSWGMTQVYVAGESSLPLALLLPGYRTCSRFWDLLGLLGPLGESHRVCLVDVIGQPGLSGLFSPALWSEGYGHWLCELLDGLEAEQADLAGISFGGYLIGKLAALAPERIRRAVFLASAGFANLAFSPYMLEANLRPFFRPSEQSAAYFLDRMVLNPPAFDLDAARRRLLTEYLAYVLKYFRLAAHPPLPLPARVWQRLRSPALLIHGSADRMFDAHATAARARLRLPALREALILPQAGHGLEFSPEAMQAMTRFLQAGL